MHVSLRPAPKAGQPYKIMSLPSSVKVWIVCRELHLLVCCRCASGTWSSLCWLACATASTTTHILLVHCSARCVVCCVVVCVITYAACCDCLSPFILFCFPRILPLSLPPTATWLQGIWPYAGLHQASCPSSWNQTRAFRPRETPSYPPLP